MRDRETKGKDQTDAQPHSRRPGDDPRRRWDASLSCPRCNGEQALEQAPDKVLCFVKVTSVYPDHM